MLEHLRRTEAPPFLRDCYRVLRPGGILRVATPDLERLCELYLERLRAVERDGDGAAADHEWLVIELYDQAVREGSGGEMLEYLRQNPLPNEKFILDRIGEEGRGLLAALRTPSPSREPSAPSSRRRWFRLPRGLRARTRSALVRSWYGEDSMRALAIGKFRLGGEVHHWLYDRVSLARLLRAAGFIQPVVRSARESAIAGWSGFCLDTTPTGTTTKPDSLFMEATKPV
jgi:SAM-dependent methyltransferase